MSLHLSTDLGVWVAALLTLAAFSFLWRDNPLYRFVEHLFVGVTAGYFIVLNLWAVIVPNLWDPLVKAFHGAGNDPTRHGFLAVGLGDYRGLLLLPALLGMLLFTRLTPRLGWLSRVSLALVIGVYAGLRTTAFAQSDVVAQVHASLRPWWSGRLGSSLDAILLTVGLLATLLVFFFSRERKGALGVAARVGTVFLMVGFGAGFGYTVMARVSMLIGRFQFLLGTWLGLR